MAIFTYPQDQLRLWKLFDLRERHYLKQDSGSYLWRLMQELQTDDTTNGTDLVGDVLSLIEQLEEINTVRLPATPLATAAAGAIKRKKIDREIEIEYSESGATSAGVTLSKQYQSLLSQLSSLVDPCDCFLAKFRAARVYSS